MAAGAYRALGKIDAPMLSDQAIIVHVIHGVGVTATRAPFLRVEADANKEAHATYSASMIS